MPGEGGHPGSFRFSDERLDSRVRGNDGMGSRLPVGILRFFEGWDLWRRQHCKRNDSRYRTTFGRRRLFSKRKAGATGCRSFLRLKNEFPRCWRRPSANRTKSIGAVPPRWAQATVEKIAINAVMAGCKPEYMPTLIACVEAITDPKLNLYALQATTGGPAVMIIINGPMRKQLNVNGGSNALGEGWRANATIGRFVQLIKRNIGGSYPGTTCKATLGWPGKYSICIGENEEASPVGAAPRRARFQSRAKHGDGDQRRRVDTRVGFGQLESGRRADQFRAENGRTVRAGSDHGHLSGACQNHRRRRLQ